MLRRKFLISGILSALLVLLLGGVFGTPVPSVSEQAFWQHVRTEQLLDREVGLTVVDQPLAEVLRSLADKYQVPIDVWPRHLVGRQGVTIDVHRVRLRSLLSLILEPHGLDFAVVGKRVVINPLGPQGVSPARLITRTYPLPWAPTAWRGMDQRDWADLIRTAIVPDTWDWTAGGATIVDLPGAMVVVHLPEVHIRVMELLARLEAYQDSADPTVAIRLTGHAPSRFEQRLHQILTQPCQVELFRADVPTALDYLARQFDIPIVISPNLRQTRSFSRAAAVTINVQHASLAAVLDDILAPLNCTFVVERDVIQVVRESPYPQNEHWLISVDDLLGERTPERLARLAKVVNNLDDGRFDHCLAYPLGDRMLLVETAPAMIERIQGLLSDLRTCLLTGSTAVSPRQRALQRSLAQPARFEFIHAELDSIVAWIERNHDVLLEVDPRLRSPSQLRITYRFDSKRLDDALRRMLAEFELGMIVLPDRILITDALTVDSYYQTHCFDVRPLVDARLGVMTEPMLLDFLVKMRELVFQFHRTCFFDGVLIIRETQWQLEWIAETLKRLMERLDRLPRDREFSAAFLRVQNERTETPTEEDRDALYRAYFEALRAVIEEDDPDPSQPEA